MGREEGEEGREEGEEGEGGGRRREEGEGRKKGREGKRGKILPREVRGGRGRGLSDRLSIYKLLIFSIYCLIFKQQGKKPIAPPPPPPPGFTSR